MKRRTFLESVGALGVVGSTVLAGCTGADGDGGAGNGTNSDTTTSGDPADGDTTTTGPFPTRVVAVEPDTVTDALDASVSVRLTQNFSETAPAELAVEVTNDTGSAQTYQFGPVVPWSAIWAKHASADATLVAVPGPATETQGSGIVPEAPTDGCWQAADGLVLPEYLQRKELAAGASVRHRYTLVGQHDDAACLPAGTYRFADGDFLGRAAWGFDVQVEHQ
ncbi:hypothetical protein [Halospeciosus flavus]|uniref:Secreted protein n=1 Tax=Halospeciosus flavus TaxID=3032283 RepID=A0ABD5Z227_9EURY|nr:hypothetical protein [Halospeciosus flavus]